MSIDLLAIRLGSITAPAGCGKTQLIADSLKGFSAEKPVLVLTHTNAGRAVLEQRLKRAGVSTACFYVSTIDSWSIRLAKKFPVRSGLSATVTNVANPKTDYPAVRNAVAAMLEAGHIDDALRSTYSRVFVDEYQDCGLDQHRIVVAVAKTLPTLVLGDPLQAIFGFAGPTVEWSRHVSTDFPHIADLDTPWRWKNANAEPLGRWLLDIRPTLLRGESVDLRHAPSEVVWIPLVGDVPAMHVQRMKAAQSNAPNRDGSVLIIGDSINTTGQREIARCTPGAFAIEAVDLKDFTVFGKNFNPNANGATAALIEFAGKMMTNLSQKALLERAEVIARGKARTAPTPAEHATVEFSKSPSYAAAAATLKQFSDIPGVRVFRPDVLRMCLSALQAANAGTISLAEAVVLQRERYRHMSRWMPRRAVGSTLLLKGLEADVSVVLYPENMNGQNLYVAMTRGSRRLVICSKAPVLVPKR